MGHFCGQKVHRLVFLLETFFFSRKPKKNISQL
jgi:hypothetical protein